MEVSYLVIFARFQKELFYARLPVSPNTPLRDFRLLQVKKRQQCKPSSNNIRELQLGYRYLMRVYSSYITTDY